MSERFGIPDHSPQHAPDHALQNPTPQGSWGQSNTDSGWPSTPTPTYGGAPTYGGGGVSTGFSVIDPRKSLKVAVFLALVLGPLGIFYVSFLNGVAAFILVIPTVRQLAVPAALALGGRIDFVLLNVLIMWCITVPWAIIGTRWRNRKFDRS
jgi:hypothetical protein